MCSPPQKMLLCSFVKKGNYRKTAQRVRRGGCWVPLMLRGCCCCWCCAQWLEKSWVQKDSCKARTSKSFTDNWIWGQQCPFPFCTFEKGNNRKLDLCGPGLLSRKKPRCTSTRWKTPGALGSSLVEYGPLPLAMGYTPHENGTVTNKRETVTWSEKL